MKTAHAILAVILALSLAGCVIHGKPKAVAPPAPQPAAAAPVPVVAPQPLSLPQTQVQLPPAQPVDPEAIATPTPPAEPPAEATPPSRNQRPRPKPPAAATTVEPPAPPVAPPEPERGPASVMLPPAESNRLKNSADAHKRDIHTWLTTGRGRRLNPNDPNLAKLQSLLKASDDAEEKGDMREAYDLADRAVILMRELQSGR